MRSAARVCTVLLIACLTPGCDAPTPQQPPRPAVTPAPDHDADARGPNAAPAPGSEEPKAPRRFELEAIDAYAAAERERLGLVGLSLAIMRRGELVLAKGYGARSLATGAPVTPETEFAIASISKQFTCAAALLLEEQGALSLDDPVAKYFPALTRADDIRLYDALAHVSGYRDFYPLDFVTPRMQRPIETDALIQEFGAMPLDFEPRSRWSYSNTGYLIVGRALERVSGRAMAELLDEKIFRPRGLQHTFFGRAARPESAATGYTAFALGEPEEATPEGAGWIHAAGAMWSTPSDLLRWDLALVGGEVVSLESYERMTTPVKLTDGREASYGCGLGVRRFAGESIIVHTGGVSGFASKNAFVPRTRSGVAVVSNGAGASAKPLADTILKLLIEADRELPEAPEVDGPSPEVIARELLRELQTGEPKRARLSADFNAYLDDAHLRRAAPRLKALGEPRTVTVNALRERGGMQVANLTLVFEDETLRASLYRTPDGVVQQFLLSR